MNTRQITIPAVLVMGMLLLTTGLAAANPRTIDGHVSWSNGTPCLAISEVRIVNTATGVEWNSSTSPTVVFAPGYDFYQLTIDDPLNIDDGDFIRHYVYAGSESNTTASYTYPGVTYTLNITLDAPASPADLIVESITANCGGYLFGNQTNEICAVIKNDGSTAASASHASFVLSDGYSATVSVSALNPGENETVCITDPTIRAKDDSVTITVTADCNDEVTEGTAGEANNVSSQSETVVNNGYKGKTYAPLGSPGPNMTTWNTYDINGSLVYSPGDSYYLSSYSYPDWTDYNVTWNAGDPSVPSGATVKEARLYVPYTWAKGGVIPSYVNMTFNGISSYTLDEHYWDEKGFSTSNPYGMLVYNVTADYDPIGPNTANLTNSYTGGDNVSIRGMELVVIYEDDAEPHRLIFINEEFDLLFGGSSKCTTPDEATAWAPITGHAIDMSDVATARLITFAPGADGSGTAGEGELIFNGEVWNDEWRDNEVHQIGVSDRDVTDYLNSTDNLVGFQSNADWMEASNAFLVVTYGAPLIAIDQPKYVDPQSQFTINITVTPYSKSISAVQYDLYYNTSVVWAEWANPGSFLSRSGSTDVTVLSIDNLWDVAGHTGKISYAETTLGDNDGALPSVDTPGILTTIHFSAIGERGRCTQMNLDDVRVSGPDKIEVVFEVEDCGVTIYDNKDPVAIGTSMYRFNNVASKFQCFAVLCPCLSTGGDDDWWGANITYVRWDFGDGQYGTSEGVDPCEVKMHEYTSWNWVSDSGHENGGYYENFTAYLTVRDDGEPQLSNTTEINVTVYIAGDTNGDGVVNIFDAACVGKHYGQEADNNPPLNCAHYWTDEQTDEADLNNDNAVDTIDAMIVGTNWNHAAWPPYYIE